jgi:hypothetical protein
MSKKGSSRSAIGVGIATLVTIMVAVLLTTFSVLTLVTASADLRLSNKTVESAENYYAADGAAEQWLADLDAFLEQNPSSTEADFTAAGFQVTTTEEGSLKASQEFSIDENRSLVVEVALDVDGSWDILKWQSVLKN